MDVELLGPIRVGGESLTSPTQSLLLCVLAAADGPVRFRRLVDAVWDDDPPPSAENSLHSHLARLRRRLGADSIPRDGDAYRLRVPTDIDRFDAAVAAATSGGGRRRRLGEAIGLWRGEPFGSHGDHRFVAPAARRLREQHRANRSELAALDLALGRCSDAAGAAQTLLAEDAHDELAWVLLVDALAAQGRRTEALRAAQDARRALVGAGLDVSSQLVAAETAALHDDGSERTAGTTPRRREELIGRATELASIHALLAAPGWVTLIGPGGVGKTRLAADVAHDSAVAATFVDLAEAEPGDLPVTVGRAVGIPLRPPYVERMIERLGSGRHLLVLDCCELVADALADFGDRLLGACPELSVLATSRRPIGLTGERLVEVEPLDADAAGELLVRRTRDRGVRPPGREHVVALCGAVDRLPLNVEMLAGALRSFSADDLLQALDDPVVVLGGREGRLVAGVERSAALLSDEERDLFERVSLFRRPFTPDLAMAVAGAGATLHALHRLRDLSLLAPFDTPTGQRLRMLDTVRAVARNALSHRPDGEAAVRSYVDVMGDRARAIGGGLRTDEELRWVAIAETEVAELRAAHRAAIDLGDVRTAMRIPVALFPLVYDRLRADLATWAEESLRRFGVDAPGATGAAGVAALGAMHEDDHARAWEHVALVDAHGADVVDGHFADLVAANLHLRDGDLAGLRARAERSIERSEAAGDAYLAVVAQVVLGLGACYGDELDRALEVAAKARHGARSIDAPTLLAYADYLEGEALSEHRPDEALELLRRSHERGVASGSALAEGVALVTITTMRARSAEPHEAASDFERSIRHWRTCGDWNLQWSTLRNFVIFLDRIGAHDHAAVLIGAIDAGTCAAYGVEADRFVDAAGRVRAELGDAAAPLEARGRSLTSDEILETALDIVRAVGGLNGG